MDYSSKFDSELESAKRCLGFGMCKIDFLDTGVCESGIENFYVTYYPQGRMKIFPDLVSGKLPLTDELIKAADSCTLCGKCDLQCYYVSENIPGKVMKAFKDIVKQRLKNEKIENREKDDVLKELQSVAGEEFATNDPAILTSYSSNDKNLLSAAVKAPDYVVLPQSTEEVAEIVKIANKHNIPFLPRSAGSNPMVVLIKGIVIDFARMRHFEIDAFNYCADVGAGITSFELQKEAHKHGMRMSIGESCVGVCANIVSTGVHSMFSHKYSMMSKIFLEAEFVSTDGDIFKSGSPKFKELFKDASLKDAPKVTAICTQAKVKLFQTDESETVVFVPFKDFKEALNVTKMIAKKNIGTGVFLSSIEMLQSIMTMTNLDQENFYDVFKSYLKINYGLFVFGNKYEAIAVKDIVGDEIPVLERETINSIIKNAAAVTSPESMLIIQTVADADEPYKAVFAENMLDYFLTSIDIPEEETEDIFALIPDKRLQKNLCDNFDKPVFSDIAYWFDYRPMAPRSARNYDVIANIYFCSFDDMGLIENICEKIKKIGDKYNVSGYLCQITPLESGRRVFLDYEFHIPRNDKKRARNVKKAYFEVDKEMEKFANEQKGIFLLKNTTLKGVLNKDKVLYNF